MQNDVLATGIMSFLMHEIVYFGRSIVPWMIIDVIPYFKKYKIQNVWTFCKFNRVLPELHANPILAGLAKVTHSSRTMGLRKIGASKPFYG